MQLSKKRLADLIQQQCQSTEVEDAFNKFSFWAPLKTSVSLARGSGAASFTRATVATVKDFEGAIRKTLIGEVRFEGQRRAYNDIMAASATAVATGLVTITGAQVDPNGGLLASKVVCAGTGLGNRATYPSSGGASRGIPNVVSVYLRGEVGDEAVTLHNGWSTSVALTLTTAWKRYALVTPGTDGSDSVMMFATSGTPTFYSAFPQSEVGTVPSEYVSVGALASPFHGAMVDGVKYFDTENGNTVASNVVTEATGAAISQTSVGYLPEGAGTNLVLQSSNFGTTWTAIGTPTRSAAGAYCGDIALDLIGDDAAGVIEGYQQTVTFTGDGTKSFSFFVKQGTSASTVFQLYDLTAGSRALGTITWSSGAPVLTFSSGSQERAPEAMGNGVWRIFCLAPGVVAANTNRVQFYPATNLAVTDTASTGTVYIGGVQAENALFASSHIPTTTATVTRNADSLSVVTAGNVLTSVGSCYAEIAPKVIVGGGGAIYLGASIGDAGLYAGNAISVSSYDGTSTADVAVASLIGRTTKTAVAFSGAVRVVSADGLLGVGLFDGSINGGAVLYIGGGILARELYGPIKNVRIAKVALSNSELVAITR